MKLGSPVYAPEYPRAAGPWTKAVNGALKTYCWCDRTPLFVPQDLVFAGRTGSCGRPNCKDPSQKVDA